MSVTVEGENNGAISPQSEVKSPEASSYSWYVLLVLVIVYILNFIDRQILSILAVDIKADLGLTDAEFQLLRRNGNLVLMSAMPDARGPLKPGDDMTAAYSYQCHQCTIKVELGPHPSVRPILRCVAGAEHLDKLEHFESTAAALKRIGDTIERGKRSRDWVMPISNDDGTDDA